MALFFIAISSGFNRSVILTIIFWGVLQSVVSLTGFYLNQNVTIPRFPLLIIPPIIFILSCLSSKIGKYHLATFDLKNLILIHIIRVPIELVLYFLAQKKVVPWLVTFEGGNYDILSGLTAPLIYYMVYVKRRFGWKILLIWNIICLFLLINVVFHAVLSFPSKFQLFSYEQPNIGLLYFPFILLPSVLVPLVLFAHLTSIYQLVTKKKFQFIDLKS